MDFGEALMAMRAGKRVRRKVWPCPALVDLRELVEFSEVPIQWVLATDWEVVEDATV